jgi:hypothetical protein
MASNAVAGNKTNNKTNDGIVEYCKKLNYSDYYAFVNKLGNKRDFAALESIFKSKDPDIPDRSYAVTVYALKLGHDKIIAFCKQFKEGSGDWEAAFYVLDNYPKKDVISYIKRLAKSPDPWIRGLCYRVCDKAKWDDLLELARKDESNKTFFPQLRLGETLGDVAARYIKNCKKE